MEFIHYVLGGILDLIVLIMVFPLLPLLRVINSEKLNTFIEETLKGIFSEEGLH